MIERGILMTASNVRAMIDGRKFQSRRTTAHGLKEINQNPDAWSLIGIDAEFGTATFADAPGNVKTVKTRYGGVGALLWVRETWCQLVDHDDELGEPYYAYRATYRGPEPVCGDGDGFTLFNKDGSEKSPWKPSIHMPREASRIQAVRKGFSFERLHDIIPADAIKEGCRPASLFGYDCDSPNPVDEFKALWERVNGPGSWDRNPWVEVVGWDKAEVRA